MEYLLSKNMLSNSFWKKYFQVYDFLNSIIPYQMLLDRIVEKLEVKKSDVILDLGSGTGNLAVKLIDISKSVYAIDYSEQGLNMTREKNDSIITLHHDITKILPFGDVFFDKIVSNNVLYSIEPQFRKLVVSEINRVLKPGGILVISNVVSGWSPAKIYLEHIKILYKKIGFLCFYQILKIIFPTIRLLVYNMIIKSAEKGRGLSISEAEQVDLFVNAGFQVINPGEHVYANQAVLMVLKK